GAETTGRRVQQWELGALGPVGPVLDAFGKQRLLTFDRDRLSREPTVEVAHEALIREWKQLQTWLDAARADVRLERLLMGAAAEWEHSKFDSSFLLSGTRLAQYQDWRENTDLALTAGEEAFLEASMAEGKRQAAIEQERQARELELAKRAETAERDRAAR